MSRGPGRIERAIHDLFDKHPEGAWTTADLCRLIYPAANRVEKKHRVAVIRAAKTITDKTGDRYRDWHMWRAGVTGRTVTLFNYTSVMSYGLARLKCETSWFNRTEDELLEQLRPGGDHHELVIPGGSWDSHVRQYIAARDGDQETADKLAAEQEREIAALFSGFRKS